MENKFVLKNNNLQPQFPPVLSLDVYIECRFQSILYLQMKCQLYVRE